MTSLSQQLASLAQSTATVALDRKKRSKIHSVSLIYDPKYAATQDYEEIYEDSLEAFEELCSLDNRITGFKDSIFSEASVRIDRLVQTKEQNEDLDNTIEAFLSLVSPFFNLSIAIRAIEWLVRRFQINVHSAEKLILCSLPYFDQPVFLRVINVVTTFPPLFAFFTEFKKAKLDKGPSRHLIIKHFKDLQTLSLFTNHIKDLISKKIEYQQLYVFYISVSLSAIASLNRSAEFVDFVPIFLEVSSTLLSSASDEAKITAYTILAVLSTAIPLSKDVLMAIIDTILAFPSGKTVNEQGIATILKLYQSLNVGTLDPFSVKMTRKLLKQHKLLFPLLHKAKSNDNFSSCLVNSLLQHDLELEVVLRELKTLSTTTQNISVIVQTVLSKVSESEDAFKYAEIVKVLLEKDRSAVVETVTAARSMDWLEMKLQTVLIEQAEDEDVSMDGSGDEQFVIAEDEEELSTLLENVGGATADSFFVVEKDNIMKLFVQAIDSKLVSLFEERVFQTIDSKVSFTIRTGLTSKLPLKVRMAALQSLLKTIQGEELNFYPVVPLLLALLADSREVVRSLTAQIVQEIASKQTTAKTPLISLKLSDNELSLLAPHDGIAFVKKLADHVQNCAYDETSVIKLVSAISSEKKSGKLVLLALVSYAEQSSIPAVKATIFDCVSATKGALPFSLFESFLSSYISSRGVWEISCESFGFSFKDFEDSVFGLLSAKDKSAASLKFLEDSLASTSLQLSETSQKKIGSIFDLLKFESQVQLVQFIIDHSQQDINFDPVGLLQSLHLPSAIFVKIFKESSLHQSQQPDSPAVPKRRRRSSASTRAALKDEQVSRIAVDHLEKLTVILQVLEQTSSSGFDPAFELLQLLFDLLDELETLGNDGKLAVYYSQEVLAACMLNVIAGLKSSKAKPPSLSVRADVVVSSIRSSSSPQVQNKLLLVMAALATLSPETVLHSVMPIFTFMGAHTIRQDDEFSSHVLERTVQCVVPALAMSAKDGQISDEIEFLMASFTSAFQHIPRHRRVNLFTNLANSLGGETSVHLVTFLCAEQFYLASEKNKIAECRSLTEFVSSFISHFSPKIQLTAIHEFLKIWQIIPAVQLGPDDELTHTISVRPVFDSSIVSMSTEELISLRASLINFLHSCLVPSEAKSGISNLKLKIVALFLDQSSPDSIKEVLGSFGSNVELLLEILQSVDGEDSSSILTDSLYALLEDLLDVVPVAEFVEAIVPIISESEQISVSTVRNVTLLASTKFSLESSEDLAAQAAALTLIPALLSNISSSSSVEVAQASWNTLGSLVLKFNDKLDSKLLLECLAIATSKTGLLNTTPEIIISSVTCIASIVSVLGVKSIGFLPQIISPAFEIFKSAVESEDESSSELIQSSVLALFGCFIRRLPSFITPNLKDILRAVFDASLVGESTKSSVLTLIVQNLEIKTVIASLCSLWKNVSASEDASSVGLFLYGMEMTVEEADKRTAAAQASVFFKFFMHALEYRANSGFDTNTVYRIESSLYQCGINYVMKLNDKNFRPLFAGLVRWAFDGEGVISVITEVERLESFFRFFNKLQDSLKSIVTGYYSYFFDSTVDLLGKFSSGDLKNITLRRVVLISLTTSFKFDQDEYWQAQSRFESISKALFDQLSNIEETIAKYLVKAITSLCQACSTDVHNKAINELMLQHIRSECKPREKFWAVRTMKTIYQKVGESWLGLLPQLVPLIAELLEDENEEVEMEVRKGLVRVIETVMGEPMDRYLE
ncbi:unnamed protein product [Kuraishia capsulata CBS 1993]|uniref:U3 small nucleolar RNA-associated protein 10 n=1 Tax=Kuraishia capsulata CBS 1993 TaxID=1382522 RepID=W6MIL8_9ASCO|nr:uncharacterized protein KUCA_T00002295001 [Kuraishia capsulata CBS 1993]CDK26324.1 unnamed protein product [Kuraishia capsulata CBS 1993]